MRRFAYGSLLTYGKGANACPVTVVLPYTASRFLPLALRRLMILCPLLVDIRFKNPCFLLRFLLLG